jgi:hypothetical protein
VDIAKMVVKKFAGMEIAKVKTGIIHLYCENLRTFVRKQQRRACDYYQFRNNGRMDFGWTRNAKKGIVYFVWSCLTGFPLYWQAMAGALKKPDLSWSFHPIACWITLFIYGTVTIGKVLGKSMRLCRKNWSQ